MDAKPGQAGRDGAHRLTSITDNLGNRIQYTLDLAGNRTKEEVFDPSNALAQTKSRVYSGLNRLVQELGALNYPSIGRYTESDLIGLRGGLNTYIYGAANLLRNTDPLGLAIWICNRQVKWYLGGIGNHTYFWNDKNGKCCGRDQGHDPLLDCKERGKDGGDSCVLVDGSEGKEGRIMDCCQRRANEDRFIPFRNDCHTSVDKCLNEIGLPNPGAPGGRMGVCDSCWRTNSPPSIDFQAP